MNNPKVIFISLFIVFILISYQANSQEKIIETVVSYTGSIIDGETDKPIEVDIFILDSFGNRIGKSKNNVIDGYYFLTGFKPGGKYHLLFVSEKFEDKQILEVPFADEYLEIVSDFEIYQSRANLQDIIK